MLHQDLRRDHNCGLDRQLWILVPHYRRRRSQLLARKSRQNTLRSRELVAIASPTPSTRLGSRCRQYVRTYIRHQACHLLLNLMAMDYEIPSRTHQDSNQQRMDQE